LSLFLSAVSLARSAFNGAGRLFSRMKAKEKFTIKEFKDSMQGIYSSSVKILFGQLVEEDLKMVVEELVLKKKKSLESDYIERNIRDS